MNPVEVIGDRDTVLAFALGGVPGQIVGSAEEARAAIEGVVTAVRQEGGPLGTPALVLVTHRTAALLGPELDRLIVDSGGPLVLEIPGFDEPLGERPLKRFVERVLGVHP